MESNQRAVNSELEDKATTLHQSARHCKDYFRPTSVKINLRGSKLHVSSIIYGSPCFSCLIKKQSRILHKNLNMLGTSALTFPTC